MSRDISDEFNDVRQMVFVPGVILSGVWLEQVISRGHLEGHAGSGPDVCGSTVASTQQNLQGAVLAGLNVFRKVVVLIRNKKEEDSVIYFTNT